jgi:ESCRT-I complex subunit VPS28
MDSPAAVHRLKVGVPATVEHGGGDGDGENGGGGGEQGKWVAEVTQVRLRLLFSSFDPSQVAKLPGRMLTRSPLSVQSFITLLDALKLSLRAKDQLHPYLSDLMAGYSRFKGSSEWEGRGRILHWSVIVVVLIAQRTSN